MKTIEAWLEQRWHDYRMIVLVAVTVLGLVLLGAVVRVAKKHGAARVKPSLIWLGTNMALIFNAEGTWHILTVKLGQSPEFSVLVFAVFEFALMRAMALATEAYRRTTKRDEAGKITQPGHPGKAIHVVWFIALSSGVIVATNAPTVTEQLLRVVLPTIVVLLWWTALTAEGQARRRGRFAYSPQRLAVRWGLWIGDEDEDLDQARSVRRVRLIVVYGHRLETKVIGAWYHRWRLARLAREATESEVALAVAQLDRTTTIMQRVVPRLRKTDEAGSNSSIGQPATLPGTNGRRHQVVPALGELTGTPVPANGSVPDTAGTGPAGTARPIGTGTGGRPRPAVVAADAGTGHVVTLRTPVPAGERGAKKAAARAHWETEVAAGRTPTGTDLAKAAGQDNDDTGVFRRWAREWAAELAPAEGGGAGASP